MEDAMTSRSLGRPFVFAGLVALTGLVAACANQPQSTSNAGYPPAYGSTGPAATAPMPGNFTTMADLHLRAAPGAHAPIVATLPAGTQVRTSGQEAGNWISVETPNGTGWVYRRFLAPG
jgi:hypothetical protein